LKSKKLLSVLLSAGLLMTAAAPGVMANEADNNAQQTNISYSDYNQAPANYEAIVKMLKKQGKITEAMSEKEVNEVANDYLRKRDPANRMKPTKLVYEKNAKMLKKSREYQVNNENGTKILKGMDRVKSDINEVQIEDYEGDKTSVKPLVILMDYPDYKHEDMPTNEANQGEEYYDDYSTEHYQNMLFKPGTYKWSDGETDFKTMQQYYLEQSGNSMLVEGKVLGWYTAKENAAHYGGNNASDDDSAPRELVKEAVQHAVAAYNDGDVDLAEFDKVNNLNPEDKTPDGLIDYLIVVHAGIGEEAGGGSLGDAAIWSHKWSVTNANGTDGYRVADKNGKEWGALEYNMDPQDGKVGVFSHEFGHALGLPDEYDTQYSLKWYGFRGDPVSRWSIMAGGSWAGEIGGTQPAGFSPECKKFFQANYGGNWLLGESVKLNEIPEEGIDLLIDEASTKGTNNDIVRIDLPIKEQKIVETNGKEVYFGGKEDKTESMMTTPLDLTGATAPVLNFSTWYNIENDWDYAYIMVSEDDGSTWERLANDMTVTTNPNGNNLGNGITGSTRGQWKDAQFDLSKYAGKNVKLAFAYVTDAATTEDGIYIDNINVKDGEAVVFEDESNDAFAMEGFSKDDGVKKVEHYYLLEVRNHSGVDIGLKHPHGTAPVEYDPGLVMWYVNKEFDKNDNVLASHPGKGYIGVVDAQQELPLVKDEDGEGAVNNATYYMRDAAFSIRKGSDFNWVQSSGATIYDPNTFMRPYFDDSRDYFKSAAFGRDLENYGLKVYVTGQSKDKSVMRIHISKDEPKADK
jgi:immune inhibitor A